MAKISVTYPIIDPRGKMVCMDGIKCYFLSRAWNTYETYKTEDGEDVTNKLEFIVKCEYPDGTESYDLWNDYLTMSVFMKVLEENGLLRSFPNKSFST